MRASGWGGRLALVLLGFLLAALLLELWLQTLAWWIASDERRPRGRARFEGDAHRVLCLGDSNTYGHEVEPEEAYPAQLERIWNERRRRPRIEVVNLGYPGTSSSGLAARLPGLLDAFAPDTILVMIEQFSEGIRGGELGSARLLPLHPDAILATARAESVPTVLLTYPSSLEPYPIASERIRSAGKANRIRVVDLARVFEERCPGEVCDLFQPDGHPTAAGHRVVAETLVAQRVVRRP